MFYSSFLKFNFFILFLLLLILLYCAVLKNEPKGLFLFSELGFLDFEFYLTVLKQKIRTTIL